MILSSDKKKLETIANDLTGIVNGGRQEHYDYFIAQLNCKHRTLQQSLMRNIIIPLIKMWAGNMVKGWYDLRNQATCELSENILKDVIEPYEQENGLPYV